MTLVSVGLNITQSCHALLHKIYFNLNQRFDSNSLFEFSASFGTFSFAPILILA